MLAYETARIKVRNISAHHMPVRTRAAKNDRKHTASKDYVKFREMPKLWSNPSKMKTRQRNRSSRWKTRATFVYRGDCEVLIEHQSMGTMTQCNRALCAVGEPYTV